MTSWRDRIARDDHDEVEAPELEHTAVVVPIFEDDEEEGVLFTRRADDLPRHAGQVSFPGGRQEERDGSLQDTAVRELEEEVGMASEDVELIGQLGDVPTTTGYVIRPFVGQIPYPYPFETQSDEVDATIFAPLGDLMDPSIYEERARGDITIHYFHYDEYTIWGATAAILVELLDVGRGWRP